MDNSTEGVRSSANVVRCFDGLNGCCSMMHRSYSGTWLRSVKRRTDEFEQEDDIINLNNNNNTVSIPDLAFSDVARVEVANECIALREMVSNQQKTIQDLTLEIEEERNASSSAANEAMSMILRLQREKAEIQMEARQFKRFTEEKISHDLQELSAMEECLYKRDQAVQSLNCEVQAYKHRLMSFGLTESEADDTADLISIDDYPPLKCSNNETRSCSEIEYDVTDIDKYAFGETPRTPKDFEFKMSQFERSPKNARRPRHFRRISTGSSNSLIASIKEMNADFNMDSSSSPRFRKMGSMTKSNTMSNLGKAVSSTKTSDIGDEDDMSDRVYTIDSINVSSSETPKAAATAVAAANEVVVFDDDYAKKTKECGEYEGSTNDPEIKKLYVRLQELEADRESMRQSILSMRTDKAQLVLLKEVAQHLCKDMSPSARTMAASKQSQVHGSSFKSIFKWIACFITWRKQARRSKYNFGSSNKNAVGLLALLEKANVPRAEHRRYTRLITQHLGSI
ncbi:myosin-binding protein 7-like [Impatiens glandulifera]|uniref:myosin-binding protein 7-like n=1 Tax=Impatiens glandulifera TaxID=253017 RepID=UPI001FB13C9E|nr:myosin-binding protein 7-like [Impatiens glandulifera]